MSGFINSELTILQLSQQFALLIAIKIRKYQEKLRFFLPTILSLNTCVYTMSWVTCTYERHIHTLYIHSCPLYRSVPLISQTAHIAHCQPVLPQPSLWVFSSLLYKTRSIIISQQPSATSPFQFSLKELRVRNPSDGDGEEFQHCSVISPHQTGEFSHSQDELVHIQMFPLLRHLLPPVRDHPGHHGLHPGGDRGDQL